MKGCRIDTFISRSLEYYHVKYILSQRGKHNNDYKSVSFSMDLTALI